MDKPRIILIGGGGHCKSCIDVIEAEGRFEIAGILDIKEKKGDLIAGYPIIGCDDDLPALAGSFRYFFITIGQIRNAEKRRGIAGKLSELGAEIPVIISPLAHVSKHASLLPGTIVMHHALVNAGAVVGQYCIINTSALIEHDAQVGDYCHISTGAIVNGDCVVENECFIGSNATLAHSVKVGAFAVVGAGSMVFKNLSGNAVYAGNPVTQLM